MIAIDTYDDNASGLESPLTNLAEATPSDEADLPAVTRAIYVGVEGDLRVTSHHGSTVTFRNILPGWHPIRIKRIHATGTAATDIVVGW